MTTQIRGNFATVLTEVDSDKMTTDTAFVQECRNENEDIDSYTEYELEVSGRNAKMFSL